VLHTVETIAVVHEEAPSVQATQEFAVVVTPLVTELVEIVAHPYYKQAVLQAVDKTAQATQAFPLV